MTDKKQRYLNIYANDQGQFLLVESYCGLISPTETRFSIPEVGITTLQNIGAPEDILNMILNKTTYSQREVGECLGVPQQHISKLCLGSMCFDWSLLRVEKLLNLFFKHFNLESYK